MLAQFQGQAFKAEAEVQSAEQARGSSGSKGAKSYNENRKTIRKCFP